MYFLGDCVGQYKNLKSFLNLCLHEQDFDIPAEWHFFATSHGKGPSNAIEGTIRCEATKASLQRSYKDQIFPEFLILTCVDWQTEEDSLHERLSIAKTVAGT